MSESFSNQSGISLKVVPINPNFNLKSLLYLDVIQRINFQPQKQLL